MLTANLFLIVLISLICIERDRTRNNNTKLRNELINLQESLKLKSNIARELIKTCEKLGAKSDLLSIICSYSDTLSDKELLEALVEWNTLEG